MFGEGTERRDEDWDPKQKNENKVIVKDGADTEGRAEFRSRGGGKPREGRQRGTET